MKKNNGRGLERKEVSWISRAWIYSTVDGCDLAGIQNLEFETPGRKLGYEFGMAPTRRFKVRVEVDRGKMRRMTRLSD